MMKWKASHANQVSMMNHCLNASSQQGKWGKARTSVVLLPAVPFVASRPLAPRLRVQSWCRVVWIAFAVCRDLECSGLSTCPCVVVVEVWNTCVSEFVVMKPARVRQVNVVVFPRCQSRSAWVRRFQDVCGTEALRQKFTCRGNEKVSTLTWQLGLASSHRQDYLKLDRRRLWREKEC